MHLLDLPEDVLVRLVCHYGTDAPPGLGEFVLPCDTVLNACMQTCKAWKTILVPTAHKKMRVLLLFEKQLSHLMGALLFEKGASALRTLRQYGDAAFPQRVVAQLIESIPATLTAIEKCETRCAVLKKHSTWNGVQLGHPILEKKRKEVADLKAEMLEHKTYFIDER